LTNIYWNNKTATEEPEDVVKKEVVLDCSAFWVQKVTKVAGSYEPCDNEHTHKKPHFTKIFPYNFNELTVPKTMSLG
jgi:hypothetical protein